MIKEIKKTKHTFEACDSREKRLKESSVDLVITSPPYPMVKMWDELFLNLNPKINLSNPKEAFELMNYELYKVWKNMYDALKVGGLLIINIGDATRTVDGLFRLHTNGAKTIQMCEEIGFTTLPQIHWWKPTNSPNKFMGSGMYPGGAYVTLENEHILIFRKGKRTFTKKAEKQNRQESVYFQNERNIWFSDIWNDVLGAKQSVKGLGRERNAAFPLELPHRLINMYSVQGDIIVDPFGGTGTTALAALINGRSSISFDIDETFVKYSAKRLSEYSIDKINDSINKRIQNAIDYTIKRLQDKEMDVKYNSQYGPVYTRQELKVNLLKIKKIERIGDLEVIGHHEDIKWK